LVGPPCSLTDAELKNAGADMGAVTPGIIAAAVARPPESWGITAAERVAVAQFLDRRKAQISAVIAAL
jgi:hypothetical protein